VGVRADHAVLRPATNRPAVLLIETDSKSLIGPSNLDSAESAAQGSLFPPFGVHRHGLIEVRSADGNVMHTLALFGKEAGEDAFMIKRLNQLPLQGIATQKGRDIR
jgi:hypothetical protein